MLACCVLTLMSLSGADAQTATSQEDLTAQVRNIVSAEGCQTDFPAAGGKSNPHQRDASNTETQSSSGPITSAPVTSGINLAPLAQGFTYIFLIILGIFALAGLFMLILRLFGLRDMKQALPVSAAPGGHALVREETLPDWETLAQAGRFGEAIHALLLAAFRHLVGHRMINLRPHRTSRELLKEPGLPGNVQNPLAELVSLVEASLFAGNRPGKTDYDRALNQFRCLHAAGSAQAATGPTADAAGPVQEDETP